MDGVAKEGHPKFYPRPGRGLNPKPSANLAHTIKLEKYCPTPLNKVSKRISRNKTDEEGHAVQTWSRFINTCFGAYILYEYCTECCVQQCLASKVAALIPSQRVDLREAMRRRK